MAYPCLAGKADPQTGFLQAADNLSAYRSQFQSAFLIGPSATNHCAPAALGITSTSEKTLRRSCREALGRSRAPSYLKEDGMSVDTGRRNALLGFSSVAQDGADDPRSPGPVGRHRAEGSDCLSRYAQTGLG